MIHSRIDFHHHAVPQRWRAELDELRTYYLDTALAGSPTALPSTLAFADPSHLVFGSDLPFAPREMSEYFTGQLDVYALDDMLARADQPRQRRGAHLAPAGGGRMTPAPTFTIGGELEVHRLGFGSMRLTGPGIWGPPEDPDECRAVLRRAVELGVDFIDTADSYGPYVTEEMIGDTLAPYDGVTVATKAGLTRVMPDIDKGPAAWPPVGRPEYLRQEAEMSLRRLKLETIDLWQLHRIDPKVPREEQFGALHDLQQEGKVRFVGLSQVEVEEIEAAREIVEIVSVQNRYNPGERTSEEVLHYCEANDIAFIPWAPLAQGKLDADGPLASIAEDRGVEVGTLALAWLLAHSPNMLPIPGTSKVAHLEENMRALEIELTDQELGAIEEATR